MDSLSLVIGWHSNHQLSNFFTGGHVTLSTQLINPKFCVSLSRQCNTTVSLETNPYICHFFNMRVNFCSGISHPILEIPFLESYWCSLLYNWPKVNLCQGSSFSGVLHPLGYHTLWIFCHWKYHAGALSLLGDTMYPSPSRYPIPS